MQNKHLRALCECAIFVAAAIALSYLKIPIGLSFGGFGGSIDLVMVPLILCAMRWGLGWGLGSGLVFGTLKFFFAEGFAINWASMLLDYSVAYMFVGFAGLFRRKGNLTWLAALVGCFGRFLINFISGVTIYRIYEPTTLFNATFTNPYIYSAVYNGSFMVIDLALCLVIMALLYKPLRRYITAAK